MQVYNNYVCTLDVLIQNFIGWIVAYQESLSLEHPTIRSSSCEFVISSEMSSKKGCCQACSSFRVNLQVWQNCTISARSSESRCSISSRTPYSCLSPDEMKLKMANLQRELCRIRRQRNRLQEKIDQELEKVGVTVDSDMHNDLKKIVEEEEKKSPNRFHNLLQQIFWDQQLEAARKSNAKGMRWHPLMICWCLFLRHQSQSAYETLRQSGCIALPSQRTLCDYTHYVEASTDFNT